MTKSNPQLEILDGLLRRGQVHFVRRELAALSPAKVPRELALPIAELARRAQLPLLGARILVRWVRPSERIAADATAEEIAEYAEALNKLGATEEALGLLATLDPRKDPRVWMFRSSAKISQWDYRAAVPDLIAYIALENDPYRKAVAQLNLAVAYDVGRAHGEAESLLAQLRQTTHTFRWVRLYGNALQASAANAVSAGEWASAEAFLSEAKRVLGNASRTESLFVEKWEAIRRVLHHGPCRETLDGLRQVRETAVRLEHWETVRDCDRYEALATKEAALAARVYHGTPHRAFREDFRAMWQGPSELPSEYDWELGGMTTARPPEVGEPRRTLNPEEGIAGLSPGGTSMRLLRALCSDLYRPISMETLFVRTFPGEALHPGSARGRVHQAVRRLRKELCSSELPLSIIETEGHYSLAATRPTMIRLVDVSKSPSEARLRTLRRSCGERLFSAGDVARELSMNARSVQRLLGKALAEGHLQKFGAASATRYRFVA